MENPAEKNMENDRGFRVKGYNMKLYRVIGECPSPYIEGPTAIRAAIIRWIPKSCTTPSIPYFGNYGSSAS